MKGKERKEKEKEKEKKRKEENIPRYLPDAAGNPVASGKHVRTPSVPEILDVLSSRRVFAKPDVLRSLGRARTGLPLALASVPLATGLGINCSMPRFSWSPPVLGSRVRVKAAARASLPLRNTHLPSCSLPRRHHLGLAAPTARLGFAATLSCSLEAMESVKAQHSVDVVTDSINVVVPDSVDVVPDFVEDVPNDDEVMQCPR